MRGCGVVCHCIRLGYGVAITPTAVYRMTGGTGCAADDDADEAVVCIILNALVTAATRTVVCARARTRMAHAHWLVVVVVLAVAVVLAVVLVL